MADQHVVEHRHGAEQRQVLERPTDTERSDAVARNAKQGPSAEYDVAAVALVEARQAVEESGLAGAVGADQSDDAIGRDVKRNIVERDDPPEAHPDLVYLQQCLCSSGFRHPCSAIIRVALNSADIPILDQ